MTATITFLGAADTVTGSKYLVQHGGRRLLVDCGLFQGYKPLRLRNWAPLPVVPSNIDAVVLTHAHLDHSGYLPLLVREGFKGRIHASDGTRDLCGILLPDSGHLQEEDAAFANRHGFSRHQPALPLYTRADAMASLKHWQVHAPDQVFEPIPGWQARLRPAGHILGASSLWLSVGGRTVLFSGDLGRNDDLMMRPPMPPLAADTVVIESTYGDRQHPQVDLADELAQLLQALCARGGVAVMPVFAVGRAQLMLHLVAQLKAQGRIPAHLPVFLDSPMAVQATALMRHHMDDHRLDAAQVRAMEHVAQMVVTTDQSRALSTRHGPMLILAASGMATGGRVLHHLAQRLGDHRNMVVLTGFQSPGTRGARLAAGQPTLRIHGQDMPVRAQVAQLGAASAHADAGQLLQWLRALPHAPDQVQVVHGEREAADTLRGRIEHELGWRARMPEHGATWPL